MKKFISLVILGATAVGCGANPCEKYVTAVETCNNEYVDTVGGTVVSIDAETACAGYDSSADALFNCYADAYNSGDCGTAEGYLAVATAMLSCQ